MPQKYEILMDFKNQVFGFYQHLNMQTILKTFFMFNYLT